MNPTVLIVDDHPLVAVALRTALRERGLDARQVDPSSGDLDGELRGTPPGLAVLDLDLGGGPGSGDGADLVPRARAAGWDVVLLTGSSDRARIAAAVEAGALGWLSKRLPFDDIVATVSAAARGERVFDLAHRSDLIAEHLLARSARQEVDRRWARLTAREREILARLVEGRRVADVARESVVSESTVRTQVRSILAKLEVRSQLEAVAFARRVR